jgi:hypothetical protein
MMTGMIFSLGLSLRNNALQESIKATPFELNFGQQSRTPLGLDCFGTSAGTFVRRIQEGISRAKTLLRAAHLRMKIFADQNGRDLG